MMIKPALQLLHVVTKKSGGASVPNIAFLNMGASAAPDFNAGNVTTHVTASHTPPTKGIILLGVTSRHAAGPIVPTVTGNGITWTQIATIAGINSIFRMTLFAADANGSTAGATTISWAAQGQQVNVMGTFSYATGVSLGAGVAGAIVQSPTNFSSVNVNGLSVNLAAAGHANNRPWAFIFRNQNEAVTHRTAWDVLDTLTSASFRGLHSVYRDDAFDTAASGSWLTGSACGIIAVELKAG
jgi:hypothetical protein